MGFLQYINQITDSRELQKVLGDRFVKNRKFFEKFAPELTQYLQSAPTRFALLADERGVNLLNYYTNDVVYGYDGTRHQMIDTSLIIAQDPFNHTKWRVSSEGVDIYDIGAKFKVTDSSAIAIKEHFKKDPNFMEGYGDCHLPTSFMPPMFCFGLAGGLFLEELREKYDFIQSVFIYEPESDFFTASCHFVDYEELYNKINSKLLCIFIKDEPDQTKVKEFFARQRLTASFAKLELTLYDSPQLEAVKNKIRLEQLSNTRGWGTYEDEMIGITNHFKNFEKQEIAVLSKQKNIDMPICIIGNGASLDESIEFIKNNQDNMILFSCGTTLRTLRKHGIKPDFQIEIERLDYLANVLKEAGLDDIPLIASNVSHPKTFALAKEKFAFFRDYAASSHFNEPKVLLKNSSPFVGNAAFSLALCFSKNIILCGLDVGYKSGKGIHSKDSIYKDEDELPAGSFLVKPNFEESEIYSNPLYNLSKETIAKALLEKGNITVYNMSDGAYINGTIPAKNPLIEAKSNKALSIKKIKTCFEKNHYAKKESISVKQQLQEFVNDITIVLSVKVCDKKDLFAIADLFMMILDTQYNTRPVAAILLGGSLKHLMFLLFMNILHTTKLDIEEDFKFGVNQILKFMQEAIADFEQSRSDGGIKNILKKVVKDFNRPLS